MSSDKKAVIQNTETGMYLGTICLMGRSYAASPLSWRSKRANAIEFDNADEAQAAITFIEECIDFELAECLETVVE